MKIPYNQVYACGEVLFTARGGQLHSFNVLDGSHISTWKHPDVEKLATALKARSEAKDQTAETIGSETNSANASEQYAAAQKTDSSEPPAKRQRVESDEAKEVAKGTNDDSNQSGKSQKKQKQKQGGAPGQASRMPRLPDRPVITQITGGQDGQHIVVSTGQDKAIWVFKNDEGVLTQLSSRVMPKRPSALVVAPDGNIICADKFGDVYALPLLPSSEPPTAQSVASLRTTKQPVTKPAANNLVVHSKRNLEALSHQQKQMDKQNQKRLEQGSDIDDVNRSAGPDFELSLLMGHVSMLSALVLGEDAQQGRRYIITADRDEHIRISRYLPYAHIIEGFCFGHENFVSAMVIPTTRPEILVSGGGDADIFVWDWKTGNLLTRQSILGLAREVASDISVVAVSGLFCVPYATESETLTFILAICEGVKAIFSWQLTPQGQLTRPCITQVPGNPLDISPITTNGPSCKIAVAVDPGNVHAKGIHVFSFVESEGRLAVDTDLSVRDDHLEALEEEDVSEEEIRQLLYNVENLRKQTGGPADGEEGDGDVEADATPAEAPATAVAT